MITTTVKIGGIDRPVSYGFNSLAMFQKMSGLTLEQLGTLGANMPLELMIQFAWCGLKDGARKAKAEFSATVEDVGDWLDENPEAFTEMFVDFVSSQTPAPTDKKKEAEEEIH